MSRNIVQQSRIGDLCTEVANWNPASSEPEATFTYIDIGSVDQDEKRIGPPSPILCDQAPSRARQLVKSGDVLVSTVRPNLNAVALVPDLLDGATASTGFCVLRPSPNKLDSRFLFHWVRSGRFVENMVRLATGASYPAVSDRIVKESTIPLPPLPEQRRIAAILDQAEALRVKRRATLAKLDTLAQSIFVEMFGDPSINHKKWPIRTIADLLESASYGTSEKSLSEGEFPVLRMNNITATGQMDLTNLKYMDLTPDQHPRYLVRTGDVLFNRTNSAELVGKTAIYRGQKPMAYAGYLIRLRVNRVNNPEYLAGFLNSRYAKRMLRGMCKSIIGMANINATEVQSMKIACPPLEVQRAYANQIGALEHVRSTLDSALNAHEALFLSLQYRAFRGEL